MVKSTWKIYGSLYASAVLLLEVKKFVRRKSILQSISLSFILELLKPCQKQSLERKNRKYNLKTN